jgi:hypothetical protein
MRGDERMANAIPTDERLLREIYRRYLGAFSDFSDEDKTRNAKIWVPIDIMALSRKFRCDEDLIFGRLYYHFNSKFGSHTGEGDKVNFFNIRLGQDRHCVNFPLLASVLSDLQDERRRFLISTRLAALSLIVSSVSIFLAIYL